MRSPRRLPALIAVALVTSIVAASGCSGPVTSKPVDNMIVQPVDPSFLHGTDHGPVDRLAAAVVTDVQKYWSTAFPRTFGTPWRDLDGGFFSVDTTRTGSAPPPCTGEVADVEGNAFFCASVDAIAWDRAALLPVLRERYGEAAVAVVLAHEVGHAVQHRSGIDVGGSGRQIEPIVTEAMADCYAGSFLRWTVDGHAPHLRARPEQLDDALRALITFRDPIDMGRSATDAHGTAFDRVSAFQDGYRDGPNRCSGMPSENRRLTANEVAGPNEGSQPLDEALRTADTDVRGYFAHLVTERGRRWHPPATRRPTDPAARCGHGAVSYCPQPPTVVVDRAALAGPHYDIGDHAVATLLASRYALAALANLHRPVNGAEAGRQAACLTGAYTGSHLGGTSGAPPSAGDLDEAVETVLTSNSVAHDAAGSDPLSGFDRVGAFRDGVLHGADACGL